jgi:ATP-binding cassette, subfamily B, bacterial
VTEREAPRVERGAPRVERGAPRVERGAPRVWVRVASWFRPYRGLVCLSLLLVALSVALSAVGPLLLRRVIDVAISRHAVGLLGWLCGAMIVAGVLSSAVTIGQSALTNWIGQKVVHDLRVALYDRVQRMPIAFFAAEPATEIQARLVSDIGGINDVLTFTAQSALASAIGLVTSCIVMLVMSWPLALASLVLALALGILNSRFAARRLSFARQRQHQVAEMLRVVGEDLTLPGVILGRTMHRHDWQRSRFTEVSGQIGELTYRQRLAGSTARGLISVTLACLPPTVYWLSGTVLPGLTLGTVVVVSTLQVRISAPIQQLLGLGATVQSSRAMFERVFGYLDLAATERLTPERLTPERLTPERLTPGRLTPGPPGGTAVSTAPALRVDDVSYRYGAGERAALDGVRAELPPGSLTLIVGESGCGKSTLAMILAGLVPPGTGSVGVAGIGPAPQHRLRGLVVLAAQDAVLFNSTLRENLLFGRPDASGGELAAAISAVGLGELIRRLPGGLDTAVGERGYELSGGERQRVALARALLTRAPVLVLDEATSALDVAAAERVHRGVVQHCRGRSLVVIAHRIPVLRPWDQVLVMERGRVAESGLHHELAAVGGRYAQMLTLQARPSQPQPPFASVSELALGGSQ